MNVNQIKEGLRVKVTRLGKTDGMTINPRHLRVRKAGVTGVVQSYVPGHGGDVWFVRHDESNDVGAYVFDEFDRV